MQELTDEKFQEIHTNEKFRNAVAYAHGCYKEGGTEFLYLKAMMYPVNYKVTQNQKDAALALIKTAKKEMVESLGNKLIFVGMGMNYRGDDIGNYRIRTNFINCLGERFFIEFNKSSREGEEKRGYITHSIKKEEAYGKIVDRNNYNYLEVNSLVFYSKEAILAFINESFNCNFTEMIVDNYTLVCNDFICTSPEKPKDEKLKIWI